MSNLFATHCDECGALIGFMSSHPRGSMICPSCNDTRIAEHARAEADMARRAEFEAEMRLDAFGPVHG